MITVKREFRARCDFAGCKAAMTVEPEKLLRALKALAAQTHVEENAAGEAALFRALCIGEGWETRNGTVPGKSQHVFHAVERMICPGCAPIVPPEGWNGDRAGK